MTQPIARIFLRYIALPFGLWLGLPDEAVSEIVNDPDVVLVTAIAGGIVAGLIESWYVWAKRKGGAT